MVIITKSKVNITKHIIAFTLKNILMTKKQSWKLYMICLRIHLQNIIYKNLNLCKKISKKLLIAIKKMLQLQDFMDTRKKSKNKFKNSFNQE